MEKQQFPFTTAWAYFVVFVSGRFCIQKHQLQAVLPLFNSIHIWTDAGSPEFTTAGTLVFD